MLSVRAVYVLSSLQLALAQAARYIVETGRGLPSDVEEWRKRSHELLASGAVQSGDLLEHRTVLTTIKLSLEEVERRNPSALILLRYLAVLAPAPYLRAWLLPTSPVPRPKRLENLLTDAVSVDAALGALLSQSLVEVVEPDVYQMHPVLQGGLLALLTPEDREFQLLFAIECHGDWLSRMHRENPSLASRYAGHVVTLLKRIDLETWGNHEIFKGRINRERFLTTFAHTAKSAAKYANDEGRRHNIHNV